MSTIAPVRPCISADSHVVEPAETYVDFIDPAYRDRAPKLVHLERQGATMVIDPGSANEMLVQYALVAGAGKPFDQLGTNFGTPFEELHPGGHDPIARLEEQDRDGVVAEVIYPSTGMLLCNHPDFDYKHACFGAYNRWIAEFCATAPDRLIGLGQTAVRTPEEGIADLLEIKALGLRGVMLAGRPAVEDYDSPVYDDFWRAVVELELPPSFHILTSGGGLATPMRGAKINRFQSVVQGNQEILGMLIFGGVFDRHPALRVVCVEADAGWAPHWMYRADHAFDRHRNWLRPKTELQRRPSEYFREHIYLTFQDDWVAFKVVDLVNAERLMWANDHPHSDATWPNSQEMLHEQTAHLSEWQKDRILRDNCKELYRLVA
jgi:predicted TIM-barrel fold metal-dependent hydrolase